MTRDEWTTQTILFVTMSQLLLATIVTNYVLTDKENDDSVILHTRFLKQYFPLLSPQNLIN